MGEFVPEYASDDCFMARREAEDFTKEPVDEPDTGYDDIKDILSHVTISSVYASYFELSFFC